MSKELFGRYKNRKRILTFVTALVGIVLIGIGMIISNRSGPSKEILASDFPDSTLAQKMTNDELDQYAQEKVDASKVTLNVYPEVNLASDGRDGICFIRNLPTNSLGQEAFLKTNGGKVIFKTGMIRPGEQVKKMQLDEKNKQTASSKGSVLVKFYDLKEKKEVGETSIAVNINVKTKVEEKK